MSLLQKVYHRVIPAPVRVAIQCAELLEVKHGHFRSVREMSCVDREGNPLPWYTYPTTEYLRQLDFSDRTVFEYGSGNSTLFWSALARSVLSVESDAAWYQKTLGRVKENVQLKLVADDSNYIKEILKYDSFDVIIVDGLHRRECAHEAVKKLRPGGMIILDNSDWYIKAAKVLREADFIQVDMTGFGPINPYAWTTSLFLHREFNFRPKHANQPEHGIGCLKQYASE